MPACPRCPRRLPTSVLQGETRTQPPGSLRAWLCGASPTPSTPGCSPLALEPRPEAHTTAQPSEGLHARPATPGARRLPLSAGDAVNPARPPDMAAWTRAPGGWLRVSVLEAPGSPRQTLLCVDREAAEASGSGQRGQELSTVPAPSSRERTEAGEEACPARGK